MVNRASLTAVLGASRIFLGSIGLAVCMTLTAGAGVQFDIVSPFNTSGFSASVLHSAESPSSGTGASASGKTSGALMGSLYADMLGDVLHNISGQATGQVGNLANYGLFPAAALSTDTLTLRFGSSAGGTGALDTSAGPGDAFLGGWLDYSLEIDGLGVVDMGTFYFKPRAESGSNPIDSPNRGDTTAFSAWGNNWPHTSGSVGWDVLDDLASLLSIDAPFVGPPPGRPGLPLGIDLRARAVPEAQSLIVWALIGAACLCTGAKKRRTSQGTD